MNQYFKTLRQEGVAVSDAHCELELQKKQLLRSRPESATAMMEVEGVRGMALNTEEGMGEAV
jgi:hypothetical protein